MTNCEFFDDVCESCGYRLPDNLRGVAVKRNCTGPGIVRRSVNFANAAARHVAAGRPRTPEAIVAERFAVCVTCEKYSAKTADSGQCRHASCGCRVQTVGLSGLNKLAWGDQACPLGKWVRCDT